MTEPYYDILFYDTKSGAKTDTLHRVLRRVFKDTGINIATVDKDSFQSYKNRHVLGYVFPGAKAGSLYREQLPENGNFDFYREEIHKGKTSLNICAMGYNACKSFLYTNPETKSEHRINSEIGMLDFHAFGPDTRLYKPIQLHPENAWTTYSAVEINFKGRNGTKQAGHFALSQGPSFKPAIEATDYEVIAHYSATKDIAILKQDIGKGTIIASGPALEVCGANLSYYLPRNRAYQDNAREIVQNLEKSAPAWAELWLKIAAPFVKEDPLYLRKISQNLGLET